MTLDKDILEYIKSQEQYNQKQEQFEKRIGCTCLIFVIITLIAVCILAFKIIN